MKIFVRIVISIIVVFLLLCMVATADAARVSDNIGVFRKTTHIFYLDYNGNGTWDGSVVDRQYTFGAEGDNPVVGKWDGPGSTHIGVWRPSTHTFYLDYNGDGVWSGAAIDKQDPEVIGDRPVSGDWNNDNTTEIGVFRSSTHTFYLDYNGDGVWSGAATDKQFSFGATGDYPVAGHWNPVGATQIGVWRPSTHTFYLDWSGNLCVEWGGNRQTVYIRYSPGQSCNRRYYRGFGNRNWSVPLYYTYILPGL